MTPANRRFPALLQEFFQRLVTERDVSAHTIASYRDSVELLLGYKQQQTGRAPSALTLEDLDAPLVLAFLEHLENVRGNSARTRNLHLTAIRSFMRYAPLCAPTALPVVQRVLAISPKRHDKRALGFLSSEEVTALFDAPDRDRLERAARRRPARRALQHWRSRLRTRRTACRRPAPRPVCRGAAQRQGTEAAHCAALEEHCQTVARLAATDRPTRRRASVPQARRQPITRSGIEHRLNRAVTTASKRCPSLAARPISPHTIRRECPRNCVVRMHARVHPVG